jgi:hypothetical protein
MHHALISAEEIFEILGEHNIYCPQKNASFLFLLYERGKAGKGM